MKRKVISIEYKLFDYGTETIDHIGVFVNRDNSRAKNPFRSINIGSMYPSITKSTYKRLKALTKRYPTHINKSGYHEISITK